MREVGSRRRSARRATRTSRGRRRRAHGLPAAPRPRPRISPSEINFRANIWGMKKLGVTRMRSLSAVGSMREDVAPGATSWSSTSSSTARAIAPTRSSRPRRRGARDVRRSGVPAGCARCSPRDVPAAACTMHDGGTYLNMEGPQFTTRAEIEHLPPVGRRRDRHDEPAGSQARARSGDLLRDGRDGDGLRLLARRARRRDGRGDPRGHAQERRQRAQADRGRCAGAKANRRGRDVLAALAHAGHPDRVRPHLARGAPALGLFIDKYVAR